MMRLMRVKVKTRLSYSNRGAILMSQGCFNLLIAMEEELALMGIHFLVHTLGLAFDRQWHLKVRKTPLKIYLKISMILSGSPP